MFFVAGSHSVVFLASELVVGFTLPSPGLTGRESCWLRATPTAVGALLANSGTIEILHKTLWQLDFSIFVFFVCQQRQQPVGVGGLANRLLADSIFATSGIIPTAMQERIPGRISVRFGEHPCVV